VAACFGWLAVASARLGAQTVDTTARRTPAADPRDTLFLRARALVLNGNGAAGRALVDSALTAATGTPDYGIALYWRAALAATAADAERDYRRVIVEYPFSPHSGDALLALAQLEMARGDRESAIDHLQRYLVQQPPNDPQRVRAGIWLGKLLLETNQLPKGCAVLLRTRAVLGDTAVETRNQVDYYASRCVGVDTASVGPSQSSAPAVLAPAPAPKNTGTSAPASTTAATTPPASTTPAANGKSTPPPRSTAPAASPTRDSGTTHNENHRESGRYTVQVAAYDTKAAAERLVTRLAERGITARVVGTSAPFRVRTGHYPTDAAATEAARQLKAKGIEGFVTTTDNEGAAPVRR
jgi:cell division septation protein DedD/TolA-binding protein